MNAWQPLNVPEPPITSATFCENSNPNQDNQCGTDVCQNIIISHSKLKDLTKIYLYQVLQKRNVIRNGNATPSRDFDSIEALKSIIKHYASKCAVNNHCDQEIAFT